MQKTCCSIGIERQTFAECNIEPKEGGTEKAPGLTHKSYTNLKKLKRDKHSSLLPKFVTYGFKSFKSVVSFLLGPVL
jgi:hypothetical protein